MICNLICLYSQRKNYIRKIKKQSCINLKFQEFSAELSSTSDTRYFDLSAKIFELSNGDTKICENYAVSDRWYPYSPASLIDHLL